MHGTAPLEVPVSPLRCAVIALAVAATCATAFFLMGLAGRLITPLWPAAGLSVGFFAVFGNKAAAPIIIGHLATWIFIPPYWGAWGVLMLPLLYPAEAWLVARCGYRRGGAAALESAAMGPVAWGYLGAPIAFALPTALISALLFTVSGRFPLSELGKSTFFVGIAHVHGIIAFAALTIHICRGDFQRQDVAKSFPGIVAGLVALCVMALAFAGMFNFFLSPGAAIFLPFPFLVMAAVRLTPAQSSLLVAIWCSTSSALTVTGSGPFVPAVLPGPIASPAELGLYNMAMASVIYLVSVGSNHLVRQVGINAMALAAADIELWEWDQRRGFRGVQAEAGRGYVAESTAGLSGIEGLCSLAGGLPGKVPDFWRRRIDSQTPALESVGRVLRRGADGRPLQAIGLLQDLSALQRAEEALIALGTQKAALRSLQARLNPHFLFNSLNVIRALVHIDRASAEEAITSLAELLRSNLRSTETALIPLRDELGQIRALLHLAKLRFGSRLETRVDVPREIQAHPVPPMMLLNLVENAITHGIGNLENGGEIAISARLTGDFLRLSIRNSGILPEHASQGIGTRDAFQRLAMLYAGRARFSLTQSAPNTVLAQIDIPADQPPLP